MSAPVQEPNKVQNSQPAVSLSAAFDSVKKAIAVGTSYALRRFQWQALRLETEQPIPVGSPLKSQPTIKIQFKERINAANKTESSANPAIAPLFSEEQAALKAIVDKKYPEDCAEKKKLLEFSAEVVAKSQPAQASQAAPAIGLTPEQIASRELFGQLLFIADRDPVKCANLINRKDFEADKKAVQLCFTLEMKALKTSIDAFVKNEASLGICNESALYAGLVPKEIAKAMVTSTGLINLGIVSGLKKALFLPGDVAQQKEMDKVFKDLEKKNTRWNAIKEQKAPAAKDAPSRVLIVATLDLPVDHEVTDVDAKRAALSAHLTLLVQTNIGNCFADSAGKLIKKLDPSRYAGDLNALILHSKLQRKVNGKEKTVEFELNGNNSDLQNPVKIGKNGSFQQFWGTYFVWQSHGFKLAANAMGIPSDKYEESMKKAVETLSKNKGSDKFTTSAQEIILELAGNDQAKAHLGYFGFTALRENPLQRSWENTLAAMAELRPRSLVRGQILQCVQTVLMQQFQTRNVFQDALLSKVFQQFMVNLNKNIVIEYSPNANVQNATKVSADGKSTAGGAFIIKGVNSGEEFQKFVVTALQTSVDSFATVAKENSKAFLTQSAERLNKFVMDKTFLSLAVRLFDPNNVAGKDPVSLPWVAPYGDDPFEVLRVYYEEKQQVVEFQPQDASALFGTLLQYEVERLQAAPNSKPTRVILCSPQHAFEFTPNTKEFKASLEGVKQAGGVEAFMKQYLKAANDAWKQAPLKVEDKNKIVKWVADNLIPEKEVVVAFFADIESIDKRAKLSKFYNELVERIKPYIQTLDKAGQESALLALKGYVLSEGLPVELKTSLSRFVVPFANTNRELETPNAKEGDKKDEKIKNPVLSFCFYPDPIAQKITFNVVPNIGPRVIAMNQDEWVNNQPWEIEVTTV